MSSPAVFYRRYVEIAPELITEILKGLQGAGSPRAFVVKENPIPKDAEFRYATKTEFGDVIRIWFDTKEHGEEQITPVITSKNG